MSTSEQHRVWVQNNREHIREYNRRRRAANPERARELDRARYEKRKPKHKEWLSKNKDRRAAWGRKYYAEYRQKYPERCNAYCRKWYQTHKHVARARRLRRRAAELGAAGTATATQIAWRWDMWGSCCWICGRPAVETDHVRPLIDGGSNHPANLRPACRACNTKRKKQWLGLLATMNEAADLRRRYQTRTR